MLVPGKAGYIWRSAAGMRLKAITKTCKENIGMAIKPGPKPIAKSTGKPDPRRRDTKETPGNTPSLKPHKHKKGS